MRARMILMAGAALGCLSAAGGPAIAQQTGSDTTSTTMPDANGQTYGPGQNVALPGPPSMTPDECRYTLDHIALMPPDKQLLLQTMINQCQSIATPAHVADAMPDTPPSTMPLPAAMPMPPASAATQILPSNDLPPVPSPAQLSDP